MKTRFLKSVFLVALICALGFSLTGCDKLDYREAISLYNAGKYEAAAEVFYALGDYEDSPELYTNCQYWIAATLADQGDYEAALPRFLKLGDYENSAQWAVECKYQMAVAAFEEGRYPEAETYFREMADYQSAPEYLRQIQWQYVFDAVEAAGTLQKELDGKVFGISAEAGRLVFFVSSEKDVGYRFSDNLALFLTRDSMTAEFAAASTFYMEMNGNRIGSSQNAAGKVDITTCTPQTRLVMESFEKTVTDHLGNTTTTTDPAESLMDDTLAENFRALFTVIPELLLEAGIEQTLNGIGFAAM